MIIQKKYYNLLYPLIIIIIVSCYITTYNHNNYITKSWLPIFAYYNNYLYILGTNQYGLDVFFITVSSLSKAIFFGSIIGIISFAISLMLGLIKGYYKKSTDIILQRVYEIFISIPIIYVLILFSSVVALNIISISAIIIAFSWFILLPYIRLISFQESNSLFIKFLQQCGVSNIVILYKYMAIIVIKKLQFVIIFIIFSNIMLLLTVDFLKISTIKSITYYGYSDLFLQLLVPPIKYNLLLALILPIGILCIIFIKVVNAYIKQPQQKQFTFYGIDNFNNNSNNVIIGASGQGKTTVINYINKTIASTIVPQNINELYSPNIKILKHFTFKKIDTKFFKLFNINLDNLKNKYMHQVSLGQLQWITLACVLSQKGSYSNNLILLDEPFAFLDNFHQRQLIKILKISYSVYNKKYIISTHNNYLHNELCNAINATVFNVKNNNNNISINVATNMVLQQPLTQVIHKNLSCLIKINNFKLANQNLLNGTIAMGGINLILGENGCGKSTLLKHIYNTIINKNNINGITKVGNVNKASYIAQNYSQLLHNNFNIATIIIDIAKANNVSYKKIGIYLKKLNLTYNNIKNKNISQISFGQIQRITLLMALLQNNSVIILDEPTSGLDYKNIIDLSHLINQINQQYKITYIIASHNLTINSTLNVHNLINISSL